MNANVGHTWHEGIQACIAQDQAVVGQQLHAGQQKNNASSDQSSIGMDPKVDIAAANILKSKPDNSSMPVLGVMPSTASSNRSIITTARESMAFDVGTITSKIPNTAESTGITRTSEDVSKQKSRTNTINSFPAKEDMRESIHSVSAGVSMFHTSIDMLFTEGGWGMLPRVVTYISTVAAIVC